MLFVNPIKGIVMIHVPREAVIEGFVDVGVEKEELPPFRVDPHEYVTAKKDVAVVHRLCGRDGFDLRQVPPDQGAAIGCAQQEI